MTRSSAPRRDFAAMQERRRSAARLFAAGKRSQAEIARELHISRQSVSRWFEAWRQDNPDWIRGAGRAGRRPKLDEVQLKQVDAALRQGAQAHGFQTNLWTLPRVASLRLNVLIVRFLKRSPVWLTRISKRLPHTRAEAP